MSRQKIILKKYVFLQTGKTEFTLHVLKAVSQRTHAQHKTTANHSNYSLIHLLGIKVVLLNKTGHYKALV